MGDLATLPTFQPAPAGYTHADFNNAFANLTIANGAVTTNKLADGAVTFAKMASVATQTLLGRSTAGTGVVEAITLGAGLALAATVLTVGWLDTDSSHRMRVACGNNLTTDRTVTITPGDSDRTITLSGNPTLGDWFDQSVKTGASPTFTATNLTGTSGITGTGALNSGSITSGFGAINVGADSITGGAGSFTTLGTTGQVSTTLATGGQYLSVISSNANGVYQRFTVNGTNRGYFGSGDQVIGGGSANDLGLDSQLGNVFLSVAGVKRLDVSSTRLSVTVDVGSTGSFHVSTTGNGYRFGSASDGSTGQLAWSGAADVYLDFLGSLHVRRLTGGTNTIFDVTATGLAVTGGGSFTNNLTVTKATGGITVENISGNTTGIYQRYVTSAGAKGYVGTCDQLVSGGAVNDFGLASAAGDVILSTAEVVRGRFSASGLAVTGVSSSTGLATHPDLLLTGTDAYINMDTTTGSGGYGIRNNAGSMEFKNSGGAWAAIGSGGGGGSVTSVDVATANGVSATGGPITGSGSFTFSLGAISPTSVTASSFVQGSEFRVAGIKVLGAQQAAEADISISSDLSGGDTVSEAQIENYFYDLETKINSMLAKLRAMGIFAT